MLNSLTQKKKKKKKEKKPATTGRSPEPLHGKIRVPRRAFMSFHMQEVT